MLLHEVEDEDEIEDDVNNEDENEDIINLLK